MSDLATRVLGATVLLPVLVGGAMLAVGYRWVGDPGAIVLGAVGLAVLGAVVAGLHARCRLAAPAVVVGFGLVAAVVVEVVVPGPTAAGLGGERLTLGVPVLARFAETWPLLLALASLAGLVELRRRRPIRPGWGTALRTASAAGLVLAVLVPLAGLGRGWLIAPPPFLVVPVLLLALSGFLAALPLVRARLLAPAVVFAAAVGVATVACWVLPVGDPVGGLLGYATWYCVVALVLAGFELAGRALLRRVRTLRSRASAAAAGPAASPSRS